MQQKRVVLGSTYPGDNPSHVSDGLRRLGELGKYMNRDQDRYWLSLQQTVSQIVQERADAYHDDQVFDELAAVIRQETDKGLFERVHRLPASSGDVEDDPSIGLVIFGPDRAFSKKAKSTAEAAALEFLGRRGTTARIHKNCLVFLAPEVDRVDVLGMNAVRNRMAWEYILENKGSLNLDQHNTNLATSRVAQAKQTVSDAIREAYRWILVPTPRARLRLRSRSNQILMNGEGTPSSGSRIQESGRGRVCRAHVFPLPAAYGDQPAAAVEGEALRAGRRARSATSRSKRLHAEGRPTEGHHLDAIRGTLDDVLNIAIERLRLR